MKTQGLRVVCKSKKRVLIVDDHAFLREGLKRVIEHEDDLEVCCEADRAHEALAAIAAGKPDAVIVDLSLEGKSGLELVKDIKARYPKLPVLVLSMHDEALYAERALRAGARGYVMKRQRPKILLDALRQILSGKYCFGEKIANRMFEQQAGRRAATSISSMSPIQRLSDRELEVFELLGQGYRRTKIAQRLNLSVKTVEHHYESIKRKLSLRDADELHRHAIQCAQAEGSL